MREKGFCYVSISIGPVCNVRVGMKSPPAEGTGGDADITDFLGPGQLGTTSTVTCDGEYL